MDPSRGAAFSVMVTLSHTVMLASNRRSQVYVAFQIGDQLKKSSVSLDARSPKWVPKEHFQFTVSDVVSTHLSVLVCNDRETSYSSMTESVVARTDVFGWATIPLKDVLDIDDSKHLGELQEYPLNIPKCRLTGHGESLVVLSIQLVPDTVEWQDGTVRVVWENERFVPGTGWVPSQGDSMESPAHYSSEDCRMSSAHFHLSTPTMPAGFDCNGWSLALDEGDREGWNYARWFQGPWFDQPFNLATARRRKWTNVYRRALHPLVGDVQIDNQGRKDSGSGSGIAPAL